MRTCFLAVHTYATDESSLASFATDRSEEVGRWYGYGGEIACCCSAVAESRGYTGIVYLSCEGGGGEGRFEGESVGFKPREEGRCTEETGVGDLRGMDVCVCSKTLLWDEVGECEETLKKTRCDVTA